MSSKGSRKTDDLFRVGKEKGFVTLDDIIYGSPETQSAEEIDDLLTELSDYGIDVVGQDSEAPGDVPAGAEDLVLDTEREAASEVVSAPEPREEVRGDTELPSSADPVSIYMRQLRQVPLLSRRAEVDAAKRLEAGRLDGICAALDTAIAAEEMRRLMRRWREREPDVLEPMELRGARPEGGETAPIPPLTPVEVVEALAELHHQNGAIQRALTPDPQKSEEERATELQRLKDELKRLKSVEKPKNIRDIEEARAHGDLSENAEYHAAKERQGHIDAEIRRCEDVIARAEVIDVTKLSGERVVFGATVELEDANNGGAVVYRIVGEYEAALQKGLLSVSSPIARALIGKEIGDTVNVQAPGGAREYEITDVRFEEFAVG